MRRVLCKLGIHKWRYWRMSLEFIIAFPKGESVNRSCDYCKIIECTDDGIIWNYRV